MSKAAAQSRRPVSAAIVAGGANERFAGEPKGLRTVHGVRLIDRVAAAIRTVTQDLVLIANAPDAEGWLPGVAVRRDSRPERGSVVGIHSALAGSPDIVLVVAWDMPFVSGDLLGVIAARARDGAACVVPEGPNGPEPFCAAYTAEYLPAIEDAIAHGEYRMSSLVARLPGVVRLRIDEVSAFGDPVRLFFNVNTASDLKIAERMAADI